MNLTKQTTRTANSLPHGLYHRSLGLPPGISSFVGTWGLIYTRHAMEAAARDRYGAINPPRTLTVTENQIVEAEFFEGVLVKAVARVPHTETHDLVIVLCDPRGKNLFVKTVWLNRKSDTHNSLRKVQYQQFFA